MTTTTYSVQKANGEDFVEVVTKSKKATAVDAARQLRTSEGVAVRVVTSSGTTVFEQSAKKAIKMSPKYTRVVDLPEDVREMVPEGMRVAYFRPRRHAALLHDGEQYHILDTATGELLEDEIETTRDANERIKQGL